MSRVPFWSASPPVRGSTDGKRRVMILAGTSSAQGNRRLRATPVFATWKAQTDQALAVLRREVAATAEVVDERVRDER